MGKVLIVDDNPIDFNELAWAIIDGLENYYECGPGGMDETMTEDEVLAAVEGSDLAQCVVKEEISEQTPALSSQIHPEANKLLSQAVRLAEGNHFQRAQKVLIRFLKLDSRNCEGWLWYSRVIGSMKAIESSLKNAIRMSPQNLFWQNSVGFL